MQAQQQNKIRRHRGGKYEIHSENRVQGGMTWQGLYIKGYRLATQYII